MGKRQQKNRPFGAVFLFTIGGPDGNGTRGYESDPELTIFEPGTTPQDAILLLEFYKKGKDITSMSNYEID